MPDSSQNERAALEEEMFALEDAADGGPLDYLRAALHANIERRLDQIALDEKQEGSDG